MTKALLIYTDFSLESLITLKKVLAEKNTENNDYKYDIYLVSGYETGDSISTLLFNSKGKILSEIRSQEFCDAYNIIKNKYPHLINRIICDVYTGYFQRVFDNYINTKNIEEAYYCNSLIEKNTNKKFNLIPYIKKCKTLKSTEIITEIPKSVIEKGILAKVFA